MIKGVALGDSWTAGFSDITRKDTPGWVGQLPGDRFEMTNLAVSGSRAAEWAHDADGRLANALGMSDRCDFYAFSLFGNDMFAAVRDGEITDEEIDESVEHLRAVAEKLCSTGRRVIGILYANPYVENLQARSAVNVMNWVIKRSCDGLPVEWADPRNALRAQGAMSGCGIHPSPLGYSLIAKAVEEKFK